jgi:hypothetical protein
VIPYLSIWPGLCLHPLACAVGAGRIIRCEHRILVLALPKLGESMSLYRAALRLARLLPLGVAIPAQFLLLLAPGFADVSPVFTLQLPAKATVLIEPASASPPLRGLHAYSVFNLIAGYPTGRENLQPAQ